MRYLPIIALIVLATSCGKEKEPNCRPGEKVCTTVYLPLSFAKFQSDELDTLIISTYPHDNQFSQQLTNQMYRAKVLKDRPMFTKLLITDTLDYLVEIPGADRQYRIHSGKIKVDTLRTECVDKPFAYNNCYSVADDIEINDSKTTVGVYGMYAYDLVLVK